MYTFGLCIVIQLVSEVFTYQDPLSQTKTFVLQTLQTFMLKKRLCQPNYTIISFKLSVVK